MSGSHGEWAFINRVRTRARPCDRLSIPIGDDTACFDFPEPARCLITTDMLLEGTHFTRDEVTPELIGRKALAVNLSDIAAMAGRPLAAFISVCFSRGTAAEWTDRLYDGLLTLADEFGVVIAGGDTNAWNGPFVISLTLIGEATERGPVLRSGAEPGDWIFVTGELGGSRAGRQFTFPPRVNEALALHAAVDLHAMIDLSDGLASDLRHILEESRVGAIIHADQIPISDAAQQQADQHAPLHHALSDGEDFELLFTVSPDDGRKLLQQSPVDVPVSHIGIITAGTTCELVMSDGRHSPWPRGGWEHVW